MLSLATNLPAWSRAGWSETDSSPEQTTRAAALVVTTSDLDLRAVTTALEKNEVGQAIALLEAGVAQGDPAACTGLAMLIDLAVGTRHDFERSSALLAVAIDQEWGLAECYLGWKQHVGFGVERDPAAAEALIARGMARPPSQPLLPVGWIKINQWEFTPNFTRAVEWMRREAALENPIALANLAAISLGGPWIATDQAAHLQFLGKASQLGDGMSSWHLARYFSAGIFVPEDENLAAIYLERASKAGVVEAQKRLARNYEQGTGVERDLAAARMWYGKAVEQGDGEAMWYLGRRLRDDSADQAQLAQAFDLFQRSARAGYAKAYSEVGYALEVGRGTALDLAAALAAYEEGWARGNSWCGYARGRVLTTGGAGQPDIPAGIVAYTEAAAAGVEAAQLALGRLYYRGEHVPQDYAEAFRWYELAARDGDTGAQLRLGYMLSTGKGIAQDYEEAFTWRKLAADQGEGAAYSSLAWHYVRGHGTERNYGEALYCYGRALAFEKAVSDYDSVEWTLSQIRSGEEIKQGQAAIERILMEPELWGSQPVIDAFLPRLVNLSHRPGGQWPMELAQIWIRRVMDKDQTWAAGFAVLQTYEGNHDNADLAETARRCAENGNPIDAWPLGYVLVLGYGVKADIERGRVLLEGASAAGSGYATLALAGLWRKGVFGREAPGQVDDLVRLAAQQGDIKAASWLRLSPTEPAKPLARHFRPGSYEEADLRERVEREVERGVDGLARVLVRASPESNHHAAPRTRVNVRFDIDREGRVVSAVAQDNDNPEAARLAEAAAREWRFVPRILAGHPVDSTLTIPLIFQ